MIEPVIEKITSESVEEKKTIEPVIEKNTSESVEEHARGTEESHVLDSESLPHEKVYKDGDYPKINGEPAVENKNAELRPEINGVSTVDENEIVVTRPEINSHPSVDENEDTNLNGALNNGEVKVDDASKDTASESLEFRCKICDSDFKSDLVLKSYLRMKHRDSFIKDEPTSKAVQNEVTFKKCQLCLENFENEQPLQKHMEDVHSDEVNSSADEDSFDDADDIPLDDFKLVNAAAEKKAISTSLESSKTFTNTGDNEKIKKEEIARPEYKCYKCNIKYVLERMHQRLLKCNQFGAIIHCSV